MTDGRQIIEDTHSIIMGVSNGLDNVEGNFSEEEFAEFKLYVVEAQKWVRLCRKKVWLRGKEGTDMAQGCLDAALDLKAALDDPSRAVDAAGDVSSKLESLARVIATKSQVLT